MSIVMTTSENSFNMFVQIACSPFTFRDRNYVDTFTMNLQDAQPPYVDMGKLVCQYPDSVLCLSICTEHVFLVDLS